MKIDVANGTFLRTNNYIVSDDVSAVIIDASADITDIESILKDKQLKAILLTHGHWDHYLTLDKIARHFDVKCYLSEKALIKLRNNKEKMRHNKNIETTLDDSYFVLIKDGDKLKFNSMEFNVIETPGHTDCSLCFHINNVLFTGDTLFCGTYGRCDLPTGNEHDMKSSLIKLLEYNDCTIIYPGHQQSTTILNERPWIN